MLLGGKLAVEEEEGGFEERRLLGELLDGISTVAQDAGLSVDEGDVGLDDGSVHESCWGRTVSLGRRREEDQQESAQLTWIVHPDASLDLILSRVPISSLLVELFESSCWDRVVLRIREWPEGELPHIPSRSPHLDAKVQGSSSFTTELTSIGTWIVLPVRLSVWRESCETPVSWGSVQGSARAETVAEQTYR